VPRGSDAVPGAAGAFLSQVAPFGVAPSVVARCSDGLVSAVAVSAAAGGALDLHEGIDTPPSGCARWPAALRLRNELTGELVMGRCKSTNLCVYCQRLYVVETVEMLSRDALEYAPSLWLVLTAREHLTRADCRRHLAKLLKAARKCWPSIEWFVQVEFQRRGALHLNLLIKGVPVGDLGELHELVSFRWCERVDALPVGQWAGEINDAGGVVKYLSKMLAHGLKAEQAPPIGWKGHRTSQTRGYLVRSAAVMRREAREALRSKREIWKAIEAGADAHDAELLAHDALKLAARSSWVLATDRGARVSATTHDCRRMTLPSDRLLHDDQLLAAPQAARREAISEGP